MTTLGGAAVTTVSRNAEYTFSKPNHDEIVLVAGIGVEGDVHSGVHVRHRSRVQRDPSQPNLRQVHLIHAELFDEVGAKGHDVSPGQLGENVTTQGLDLLGLPRGTVLRFGHPRPATTTGATTTGTATTGATMTGAITTGATMTDATMTGAAGTAAVSGVVEAAAAAELNQATADAVAMLVTVAGREADGTDSRPAVVLTGLRNPCPQIDNFSLGLLKEVVGRGDDGSVVRKGGVMGVVLRGGTVRVGDPITVDLPGGPHLPLEPV